MLTPFALLRLFSALFLIAIFSCKCQAQSASPGNRQIQIEYQSPNDKDTYVPARTTLILRPDATTMRGRSASDFSFDVRGESSKKHSGKIVIADDYETVIFKPDIPFMLNEHVRVRFSLMGKKPIDPFCYDFQITPMTDQQQRSILNAVYKNEQTENSFPVTKTEEKRTWQMYPVGDSDSLGVSIDTLISEKVAPGFIFAGQAGEVSKGLSFLAILDNTGAPNFLHHAPSLGYANFRAYMNNSLSYFRVDTLALDLGESGKGFILDTNYMVVDSFTCGNGYIANEHEFQFLRHQHALLIAYDARDMDMRQVTGNPNAAKRASVVGGIIQEIDSKKNVVFQWRTWDHFQVTDIKHFDLTNPNYSIIDYAHLNSARRDSDGNILASFRAMDEVTKINSKNGKIMWRWGGKNNYFTFAGDTLQFSSQHDVQRLPNGNITMMDNGNYRKTVWGDGSYHDTSFSRAIEYNLDENSLTATAVWQYRNIPYTFAGGNVERLINDNTFIGLGVLNIPNAIEVTPEGEKVFQISFLQGAFNYRTFRFDYPAITPFGLSVSERSGNKSSSVITSIFPNPATSKAIVTFTAPSRGSAQIELVDIVGRTVSIHDEIIAEPGSYSVDLDLQNLPSGTYYCRLSQGGVTAIKSLVVQK